MFFLKRWYLKNRRNVIGFSSAIVCEIIFGFSFLCTKKVAVKYNVMDLLAWRFTLAVLGLSLCQLFGLIRIRVPRRGVLPMIGLGLLFPGGYFIFEALGVRMTTSSEVGLIIASVPAITLLLSMLITKERAKMLQVLGIILSILGVVLCVLSKGVEASFCWTGYILIFLALLFYCLYIILSRLVRGCNAIGKTYVILTVGCVLYFSAALIRGAACGHTLDFLLLPIRYPDFLYPVLYLGIMCSCVALALCNLGVRCIGATHFASFIGVETIVAILAGIVLLHEPFSRAQIMGTICVLTGIYLANMTRK